MALETVAGHVARGDHHVATIACGGLEVLISLINLLHPRERPPEDIETVFVDPVNIPRP
jgi:hypothetical protein